MTVSTNQEHYFKTGLQSPYFLIWITYSQETVQIASTELKRDNLLVENTIQVNKISKETHLLVQIHSFEILQNQICPIFQYPMSASWNERGHSEQASLTLPTATLGWRNPAT